MVAGASACSWPSKASELLFQKRLGRGYFGEVWQCKRVAKEDSAPLAVKKVPLAILQQHGLTDQMDREIAILRSLKHPHIVQLHFDFRDDSHVYLGMEFAEGGGMFELLSKSGKFTSELSARYFYEVCDALEYLHGLPEKVIHRDIKPENILLDAQGGSKLADFGWSNVLQSAALRATFEKLQEVHQLGQPGLLAELPLHPHDLLQQPALNYEVPSLSSMQLPSLARTKPS